MLEKTIFFLIQISLLINMVRFYFTINKMWPRKSSIEVASSVSITATLLSLAVSMPFFVRNVIEKDYWQVADRSFGIVMASFQFLVAIGFWVRTRPRLTFFKKVQRAFIGEKEEVGTLLKSFIRPNEAPLVMDILYGIAMIDSEMSKEEKAIILEFCELWEIDNKDFEHLEGTYQDAKSFLRLRQNIKEYIALEPPKEQASQLIDIINLLVDSDAKTSEEEKKYIPEITQLLSLYVTHHAEYTEFFIILIPRNETETEHIQTILELEHPIVFCGQECYLAGSFYHYEFAEAICDEYRNMGFMAVIEIKKHFLTPNPNP